MRCYRNKQKPADYRKSGLLIDLTGKERIEKIITQEVMANKGCRFNRQVVRYQLLLEDHLKDHLFPYINAKLDQQTPSKELRNLCQFN